MLLFLLVVLVEFIQNMSVYNTKASSRKGDTKENFLLQRYLKQNYEQQLLHKNVDEGLKLICGMTDFSEQQNNHINRPDLQNSTPQRTTSNKRPLLAANINSLRNIRNNNNNNNNNCTSGVGKIQQQQTSLSEESIRNNVQIVLNNIQRNAAKHQQMLKSGSMMGSPESDFNSNLYLGATTTATAGMLGCSIASSHDFTHDNSDYQWFLDYGYRDGITHQSVLSSLSASYNGIGELSYYEDLAKNIDANLAEVDMESFRTEDIHSLLTNTIPTLCHKKQPGSMTDNANKCKRNLDLDNSICKSELLFSPVRESHISVDSLDMDGYPNEEDIILTCQANKDNYTIAFEGSVMYSDESYYGEFDGSHARWSSDLMSGCFADGPEFTQKYKQQQSMNLMQLENIVRKKAMEQSMSRSDNHGLTTWSKLRKNSSQQQLPSRCPSRNNNIQANHLKRHLPHCFVHKSSSMPNLKATQQQPPLNVSQAISNSSVDSYGKLRSLLPMYQMPISTSDNDDGHHHHQHSTSSNEHQNQSTDMGACDIDNQQQKTLTQEQQQQQQHLQPSFNLVKLFIKQKSSSTDTCMDVSSGCWPSDSTNSSSGDNNTSSNNNNNNNNYLNSNMNNQQQRLRKKSMNDSGKGSALSRHDEEELRRHHEHELRKALEGGADDDYPFDSLDAQINNPQRQVVSSGKETNDFNREVFDSPSRRQKKNYREFNIIRNQIKNPIVFNLMNNNSISHNSFKDTTSDTTMSRTSENLTQIFNSNSSKTTTKIPIEMLTKSMQTSTSAFVNTATAVAAAAASTKEKYRIVPPSFLAQLKGEEQKASVFVIYPNYALPDLGFLKQQQPSEVILSPLSFKEPFSMKNKQHQQQSQHKRPFSMNATDNFYLNRQEYKHVKDWPSLMTLLPREYRKLLKNIPECQEANKTMMDASMSSQKPIFCMTPPIRRGCGVGGNSRPISCDCVSILTQTNNYSGSSSGESSSQPPSSGYRGSSTMLTDSELEGGGLGSNSSLKNMYVYQYEASGNDESNHPPRPPSGRHQRGILRRTNTNIRLPPAKGGTAATGKRNSMFEDPVLQGMTVAEKRRSLQDPYYMTDTYNIIEDFIAETNAELAECDQQQLAQGHGGLPNYPKQRDSDKFNTTKQQLRDFDLNKAVTNKLNAEREDLAARMRAENFLTSVPKSELKHYAEVASLLESIIDDSKDISTIDCSKLRNVVSRALSSQKRVSFDGQENSGLTAKQCLLRPNELHFTTPPNSPNMSTIHNNQTATAKGLQKKKMEAMCEKEKQDKVACNRFKRLQIQWELLSKESAALAHDMQNNGDCLQFQAQRDTKSGGNTPVGHNVAPKSRIPRPVSYPTSKGTPEHTTPVKTLRSPSRMVPPKKYSAPTPTPAPRTPSKAVHTTPKKTASIPRTVSRTR